MRSTWDDADQNETTYFRQRWILAQRYAELFRSGEWRKDGTPTRERFTAWVNKNMWRDYDATTLFTMIDVYNAYDHQFGNTAATKVLCHYEAFE